MADQLRQAARAYRQALAEEEAAKQALAKAREQRKVAAARTEERRGPLAAAIVDAARTGMRQRDILDAIEHVYTRETVRRICLAAGLRETGD